MGKLSRRSVVGGSLGLVAATTLGRPYIANAAAKTAVVWMNQGFIPQEDEAFKKVDERQHARLQHHAVHGTEPEDDLGADQR